MNKTKNINKKDLNSLLTRAEDHFFDKKAKEVGGAAIQKIAVAFANADGGDIIIGIKDDRREPNMMARWDGVINPEGLNYVFQNLQEITPSLPYTSYFLSHPINNTLALTITIEKSNRVHSTSNKSVYQRIGAQSLPIKEPSRITELSFAKGEVSFEDSINELPRGKPRGIITNQTKQVDRHESFYILCLDFQHSAV